MIFPKHFPISHLVNNNFTNSQYFTGHTQINSEKDWFCGSRGGEAGRQWEERLGIG